MKIRELKESDYDAVILHLNEWWGGRNMSDMLPRLFFKYFSDTCFAMEDEGEIKGFLAGFIAQNDPETAYVHFIGIDPDCRQNGLGKALYSHFFKAVGSRSCKRINAVTSTVNKTSLAFHTGMGFSVKESEDKIGGISYFKDYDGPGEDRFVFDIENPEITS